MISALGPVATTVLIFGGCCPNVFALEAIIQSEPGSGLLITFVQFVFTTCAAYLTQFDARTAYTLRSPRVPVSRWALIAAMFFGINMLNNWAFAYSISVPVHIILRSFGSVTTMVAGVLRGKRYSPLQVLSVIFLTVGVLISAWGDSENQGKSMSVGSDTNMSEFAQGLCILLVAQFLSAFSGAFVEDTYTQYTNTDWKENLFYSHFLSLPLFLPLMGTIRQQYEKLIQTPPLQDWSTKMPSGIDLGIAGQEILAPVHRGFGSMPQGIAFLLTNAVTQLACISGVNLLAAKSSAVTVTIVLNIRKLVSFIFSTWLFGHRLNPKMIVGSTLVFGSGALYGWETSWRLPRQKAAKAQANGSTSGTKTHEK